MQRGYIGLIGLLLGVAVLAIWWAWNPTSAPTETDAQQGAGYQTEMRMIQDAKDLKAATEARDREMQAALE